MRTNMLLAALAPAAALLLPTTPPAVTQPAAVQMQRAAVQPASPASTLIFPTAGLIADEEVAAPKSSGPVFDTKGLEQALKGAAPVVEGLAKEAAPILQKGLDTTLQEGAKGLKAAEPVLKQKAEELTPVLQSAGSSALEGLKPVLKKGVDTAGGEASGLFSNIASGLQQTLGSAGTELQSELQKTLDAAPSELEKSLPKELKDAKPILDEVGKTVTPQLQKGLSEAKPVIKQKAGELLPVLQSAGGSAAAQLAPFLRSSLAAAGSSIQAVVSPTVAEAAPIADDAVTLAAIVLVPFVLFKAVEALRAIAVPALGAFVVLVGLGLSTELSSQVPSLGSPFEVFVRLGAVTVAGVAGLQLIAKVSEALSAVGGALSGGGGKAKAPPGKATPKKAAKKVPPKKFQPKKGRGRV